MYISDFPKKRTRLSVVLFAVLVLSLVPAAFTQSGNGTRTIAQPPPTVDTSGAILVLTWGELAIIGIVAFVVGTVATVVVMLAKRAYGIMVLILREVGYSYKVVYSHKYNGTQKDFRKFNRTYHIDLSRTAWLDWANRPVLVYELETLSPVEVKNTSKRLKVVLQSMKIEFSKKGMRPSDPFDLLFGRKLMEMLFLAIRRKTKISTGVYIAFVVIIILASVMSYLLGNIFPVIQVAHTGGNGTTITHTTQYITTINGTVRTIVP